MDTNKYIPQIEGDGSAMREHMRNLNKTIEELIHQNDIATGIADMLAMSLAHYTSGIVVTKGMSLDKNFQRAEHALRQYELFKESRA